VSQERTEEPTQHRLAEARKKGQVAKSNDAVTAFILLAVFLYFASFGKKVIFTMALAVQEQASLCQLL